MVYRTSPFSMTLNKPYWKSFFAVFYCFPNAVWNWRAAAFVLSSIHLLLLLVLVLLLLLRQMHTIREANFARFFSKNVWRGGGAVAPGGVPKCQICCVAFWGYLFVNFHFPHLHILPVLSTLSPPTCPLSHFTPLLPLTEEVNKKLSHRGQNAVIVTKAHERNTNSEHTLYLCIRQSRLARRIMFSTCSFVRPSVCPFVRSFVRLLPNCERYTSKTNELVSMEIGFKSSPGARAWTVDLRGQEVKGQGYRSLKLCLEG